MVKFTASIQEISKADPVMDFTMCLLNSVTTGHILHLQSRSYSQHMALGAFYDGIGDLVDSFIEAFQGKYGLLTKYPAIAALFPEQDPVTYLTYLSDEVATLRRANGFPQDSELQNEVDNIANLINSTLYKLRFLA
jgi:hypothetical protein